MSYSQFGYTYPATSQILVSSSGAHSPCCPTSDGSPTQPVCAYDSRLLTAFPTRLSAGFGIYGASYADSFYTSLPSPYDLKESRNSWNALQQSSAACYPYDLSATYPDRYGSMDSVARRKNATRETTNTLKAWLYEHRKNPYPTKGEKIMLAIITKMTLTQVSTWFANARRRLKKENKMTWEPRNKTSEGEDRDSSSPRGDEKSDTEEDCCGGDSSSNVPEYLKQEPANFPSKPTFPFDAHQPTEKTPNDVAKDSFDHLEHFRHLSSEESVSGGSPSPSSNPSSKEIASANPPPLFSAISNSNRPKIWSLARTATSDSPPTIRRPSLDADFCSDSRQHSSQLTNCPLPVLCTDRMNAYAPCEITQGRYCPEETSAKHNKTDNDGPTQLGTFCPEGRLLACDCDITQAQKDGKIKKSQLNNAFCQEKLGDCDIRRGDCDIKQTQIPSMFCPERKTLAGDGDIKDSLFPVHFKQAQEMPHLYCQEGPGDCETRNGNCAIKRGDSAGALKPTQQLPILFSQDIPGACDVICGDCDSVGDLKQAQVSNMFCRERRGDCDVKQGHLPDAYCTERSNYISTDVHLYNPDRLKNCEVKSLSSCYNFVPKTGCPSERTSSKSSKELCCMNSDELEATPSGSCMMDTRSCYTTDFPDPYKGKEVLSFEAPKCPAAGYCGEPGRAFHFEQEQQQTILQRGVSGDGASAVLHNR